MATRKKTAKKKVSKKKVAKKKVAKKVAAKKKTTKKTVTSKATSKKKTAKKKAKKKVSKKKVSKKKTTTKKTSKKKAAKKKTIKKKATAKPSTGKKKTKKKVTKKKVAKKKPSTKKVTSKKKTAAKKTAGKKSTKGASTKNKPASTTVKTTSQIKQTKPIVEIDSKKIARAEIREVKPERHKKNIDAMKASSTSMDIHGIAPYKPNKGEEYMSSGMENHFREILRAWKKELMVEVDRTMDHMQDDAANFPDPTDRATQESEFSLELRTRDRERKLLKKINSSLEDISIGDYGYCEHCGIEIGLRRLEARPTADLCIDCKTLDEIREKQMGK